MGSSASWLDQLFVVTANSPKAGARQKFNPRPKGVIQPGRSTDVVRAFLEARRPRLFTRAEIITATGCTPKAVTWAVYYLCDISLARSVPDASRNERYRRYGATPILSTEDET